MKTGNRTDAFPIDAKYKEMLAKALGLREEAADVLAPVMGPQELKAVLCTATFDNFLGTAPLRINLHTHSEASDGTIKPEDFLDTVREDMARFGIKEMIVALTDHDTLEGLPVIVEQIVRNPQKYKNLRFVAGCELSTAYISENAVCPVDYELLWYGVNPFDAGLVSMLDDLRAQRKKALSVLFALLKQKYPFAQFDEAEFKSGSKDVAKGVSCALPYALFGYAREKINRPELDAELRNMIFTAEDLEAKNEKIKIINRCDDLFGAFGKADFGFLAMAHPARVILNHKLAPEFIQKCNDKGKDAGLTMMRELLEYNRANKVEGLEIFYDYKGDLGVAFDKINRGEKCGGETEKWLCNIIDFANEYKMLRTGGLDSHGLVLGRRDE